MNKCAAKHLQANKNGTIIYENRTFSNVKIKTSLGRIVDVIHGSTLKANEGEILKRINFEVLGNKWFNI